MNIKKEITPYESVNGEFEPLFSFARQAALLLDPNFIVSLELLSEEKEEEPHNYQKVNRYFGSKDKGFEVKWQVDEVERGSVTLSADTIEIKAYGLSENLSLFMKNTRPPNYSNNNRTLQLQVSGPKKIVEKISEIFVNTFSTPSLNEKQIEALINSGRNNISTGRWDEALKEGILILSQQPDNPEANFIVGVANAATGKLSLGENYLKKAVEGNPGHYDAWYNLGLVYKNSKKPENAIECYKKALEIDPNNHAVFFQLGHALKAAGKVEEAIEAFQYAVYTSPNPNDAWHYTGMDFTPNAKKELEKLGKPWTSTEQLKPIIKKEKPKKTKVKPKKGVKTASGAVQKRSATLELIKKLNQTLLDASINGSLDGVKEALEKGAKVDAVNKYHRTALLEACDYKGYIDIARFLIEHGADVDFQEKNHETPLIYASMYGHVEIVKLLLNAGADVNKKGGYGRTPLMFAAKNAPKSRNFFEIVQILLQKSADVNLVNEGSDNILLDILWEEKVDLETVKLLIENGLDVNYKSKYNHETALMRAAHMGYADIVKLLIENGADIRAKSKNKETALVSAFEDDKQEVVKLLLENGADINTTNRFGDTVLNYAAENGHLDLVEYLFEKGADVNIEGDLGITPLMEAAKKGHYKIVEFLVDNGANINASDGEKETALMKAARYGNVDIIKYLVDKGAEIGVKDSKGNPALFYAASAGKTNIVQLLLEKGADIHTKNNWNWNALMQASVEGNFEAVQLLLNKSSKIDEIEKEKGATALILASWKGAIEVVKLLLEKGADKNIKDINGDTALDHAIKQSHADIVNLLKSYK